MNQQTLNIVFNINPQISRNYTIAIQSRFVEMMIHRIERFSEDLEKLIKNNDFDEFTIYYYNISNTIKNDDENYEIKDIYKIVLDCFKYCVMYNNTKIFKYLYTIFNEEDLNNYQRYIDLNTIYDTLKNLIRNKQYEMFRYLEPILSDATKLTIYPDSFVDMLRDISIQERNYEIFEYVVNNYEIDWEKVYCQMYSYRDDEKRRFYQILFNSVPFEFDDYKTQKEITHDMIQCGAFEFGTFDEYIDNYLYGINTLIKTYKHKKNYVMDKIFYKNK